MAWSRKDKVKAVGTAAMALALAFSFYADKTNSSIFTDPEGTKDYVTNNLGLTSVKTGGYSMFGCHNGDLLGTKFTAKNAEGKDVSGTVCKSWFGRQSHTFD